MSKQKKKTSQTTFEVLQKMRRSWDGVRPVTKVVPSKKKYRRIRDKATVERQGSGEDF